MTPLKIDNRLFLCTPHQSVIALDATTGAELWRYDPQIQGELALQHLTCRGLSYQPATGTTAAPVANASASASATAADANSLPPMAATSALAPASSTHSAGQPIAARSAPTTRGDCDAKLYMPTADGRVLALDPGTGAVCTHFGNGTGQIDLWANMPNVKPGSYYSTSPVVVARGLLIVGGTDRKSTRLNSSH